MIGYILNENGFFVGLHKCQKNPMSHIQGEPEYLMPLNATTIAPPEEIPPIGKIYKFDGEAWIIVEDPIYAEEFIIKKMQEQKEKENADALKIIEDENKKLQDEIEANMAEANIRAENRKVLLESAKTKLFAVGLTEEEIKALAGIK